MYFFLKKMVVLLFIILISKNNLLAVVIVGKINDVGYFMNNSLNNVFYVYNKNYINYIAVDVYFSKEGLPFVVSDFSNKTNVDEFYLYKKRDNKKYYLEDFLIKEIENIKLKDNFFVETNVGLTSFVSLLNLLDGLNYSLEKNVGIIVKLTEDQKIDKEYLKNIINMIDKYDFNNPEKGYMIWLENIDLVKTLNKDLKFKGKILLSFSKKSNKYRCVFFKKKCKEKEFSLELASLESTVNYIVIDMNDFVNNSITFSKSNKLLKLLKNQNIEIFFDNKMKKGVDLDKVVDYLRSNLLRGVISSNFEGDYFLNKLKNDF
jgi:hypothetical protein